MRIILNLTKINDNYAIPACKYNRNKNIMKHIDNIIVVNDHIRTFQFDKLLQYNNYDLTKMCMSLFCYYCKDYNVIKYVFDNSIDLECVLHSNNNKPIHYACLYENLMMVSYLIKKGVNIKDNSTFYGHPIHIACLQKNLPIVKCLFEHGADITVANPYGWIPIHFACLYDQFEMAKYLIKNKVNLEYEDNDGITPLYYAIRYSDLKIVKLLIDNKVNLEYKNKDGQTALHYAFLYGKHDVVKLLKDYQTTSSNDS